MSNKLSMLLELMDLIEDDKVRMSTFIDPKVFSEISDEKRKEFYDRARNASSPYEEFYWSNRALGYKSTKAKALALDALKKERGRVSTEYVLNKKSKDDDSGGEGVAGVKGEDSVSIERKDAIKKFISNVKNEFSNYPGADKVLSVLLIQHGFDELIPKSSIPSYDQISSLIRDLENQGKTKWKSTPATLLTTKSPEGLGVPIRTYYKVMDYIKKHAEILRHNESFLTGLTSLLSPSKGGGSKEKSFKLSNLEPMIDVIKRDLDRSPFKYHGLHVQGLMKEHGEDMLTDLPSVQHVYGGTALVIPVGSSSNLNQILKKSVPGKKVILFGYNKQPQALRKGWEGFPYKTVENPTLLGSYALSPESKAESLLRDIEEGFQCCNYQHASGSCNCGRGDCQWGGFPSVGENMERECPDYNKTKGKFG